MSDTMLLTEKAIARMPLAEAGQYKVRDVELKGFFVRIGKRTKTYMVQGEHWQDGCREFAVQKKLGEFNTISARDARTKAKEMLVKFTKGERPDEPDKPRPGAITLRMAWVRYRDAHMVRKGRAARTIENYQDYMERLLGDWLDWPLAKLGQRPNLVIARHEDLSVNNGPYIANSVMKVLRAIYNHALRGNRDLPTFNPVMAIDWNVEHRRDTGMGEDDLGDWFERLLALDKPLRREFHLFTLLSGSRPTAIKVARVEHLDLRKRILHIPKPKGGADKAFDIPLSRAMIRCLVRAMRIGRMLFPVQSDYWLFPADSASGHLIDHKEDRDVLPKWGNDLRQTYRTLAQVAEVSELDIHLLMNHSLRGVNAGYITRDKLVRGHLRKQQERISAIIVVSDDSLNNSRVSVWLKSAKMVKTPNHAQWQLLA
jgi:integrase